MNKYIIISIIAVLAIAGVITFRSLNGNVVKSAEDVKEFTLDATRFQYLPDKIEVNLGEKVKININNIDTVHGIRIPDFNVRGENSVEFIADKQGEFDFYCTVMCGSGHKEMKGRLIVK